MGIELHLDQAPSSPFTGNLEGTSTSSLNSNRVTDEASRIGMAHRLENDLYSDSGGHPKASKEEMWGPSVIKVGITVQETQACGTLYIDPGGGYGARQLTFCSRSNDDGDRGDAPSVSLGLHWKWPGGQSEGLPALWELLHELGHGLHLLLSSQPGSSIREAADTADTRPVLKHFGGLHLPLDILEVPSMLMEKLAMDPDCLQVLL